MVMTSKLDALAPGKTGHPFQFVKSAVSGPSYSANSPVDRDLSFFASSIMAAMVEYLSTPAISIR
jgi:hypothetical protein